MIGWIIVGFVTLILLIFIYIGIKNRILRHKQMKIFSEVFSDKQFPKPTIEFGFVYWWPTFKITFETSKAFQNAKQQGLLGKFEAEIGNIYGPEFDPARAISYLYPEKKY